MQEEKLIQLLKARDQEAFRFLVGRYQPMISAMGRQFFTHYEDVQDHSQEVFLKAIQNINNFRGESGLSTWIYRIGLNTALRMQRQSKKRSDHESRPDWNVTESKMQPAEASSLEKMEKRELQGLIHQAMNELPEKQRIALVLARIEGFSYAEVAEIMELSATAVDSLIQRARNRLRKRLASYYQTFTS